ncbi:hypothetical protein AVEN_255262-1 [Araneus ventricosus]|uniref:Uncharacterized protein n=1 Tax=Araneus ventricosus TaxID=182803 RepID=A0A4Y2BBH4_ARAVE|nr:hypothetical protein AVEN_255262-1 [Araneus ventricosus]
MKTFHSRPKLACTKPHVRPDNKVVILVDWSPPSRSVLRLTPISVFRAFSISLIEPEDRCFAITSSFSDNSPPQLLAVKHKEIPLGLRWSALGCTLAHRYHSYPPPVP